MVAQLKDEDVAILRISKPFSGVKDLKVLKGIPDYGSLVFSWSLYQDFLDENGNPVHVLNKSYVSVPSYVSTRMTEEILVSGDILPGASGSPVFNAKGELIGVLTGVRLGGTDYMRWYITVTPGNVVGEMFDILKEVDKQLSLED